MGHFPSKYAHFQISSRLLTVVFQNSDGKERFFYNSAGELVEVQPRPHLIPGLKDITQIACGADHALALDASGDIWAWGISEQGQLGRRLLPRSANLDLVPHRVEICRKNAKYIASGQYHSFAVDNRDNVWAWWLNSYGEARHIKRSGDSTSLPYPMKIPGLCGKGVVLLDGGAHHSVAVTASGECFVWGRIDGGQLGVDFTSDQLADGSLVLHDERGKPRICAQPVVLTHIGKVSHASCGTDHTIFVNKDGEAYSAGFGSMGQLGRGAEDEVPVARLIKDKALKDRVLTWTGAGGQFSLVAGP
jgi:regulator of chromosome condensation